MKAVDSFEYHVPSFRPSEDPENLLDEVRKNWHIDDVPFPLPRTRLSCPVCYTNRARPLMMKQVNFSIQTRSLYQYRADILFKCWTCSLQLQFGIPVPEEMWEARRGHRWRGHEIRGILEDHFPRAD